MNSRFLFLSSAALLFPMSPVFAQQQAAAGAQPNAPAASSGTPSAQPTEDTGDEEEIVITGARPRGSVVGDIPPENTLDARDVRATGATNITELLDAISPQIGSARGRGGEPPVLLLNGQRISGFRELRDIPTEAIVRVEILPEEVALKYGYAAEQKVVNIVLRNRFRSSTAQLGAGLATEGGYANGNADFTRFLVQRNGRTTFNLHAEGNSMLAENERDICMTTSCSTNAVTEQELAARSLVGTKRDLRGSATFNRNIFGNVSATLNSELEHSEGRSLIGLNETLLEPLVRDVDTDTAHLGTTLNGQTKSHWRWTVTGNADLNRNITHTDRNNTTFPEDRARTTTVSGDLTAIANGNLFELPAGSASTTLTAGLATQHLDASRGQGGVRTDNPLSRTTGNAAINVDLPVSRRGKDFSALGNLTLNANAEVDQLSDFGTLTTIGAGANFSPVERLSFIASWTREEGAPTIHQLGDPVLNTPDTRIFDFTTGETVLVNAITGGNRSLEADRRNVWKLGANWQPWQNTDFRLRADYVHQSVKRPISNISVTPAIEAAFPRRFVRCPVVDPEIGCDSVGQLQSVNLTPVNFDSSRRDTLRIGFDFTHPLKSRRPSQAVIDQMRAQFGFGPRGTQPGAAPGAAGVGPSPEGAVGPRAGGLGEGRGGGFGGRGGGGGFFGGAGGGQNRGRIQFSLTDTITFVDKVKIAPGLPDLDYRHGDAAGSLGGTPLHQVEAQLGYFNNGIGARLGANWRSATDVNTLTGDDLHFSPVGTFDLRFFANPGDIPEMVVKHPWLRGTQVRLELNNVFDSRPRVHDANGVVPLNYQADLLNPIGRTIMISFRKLFLPSPATFRRLFEQERRQQQSPATTR